MTETIRTRPLLILLLAVLAIAGQGGDAAAQRAGAPPTGAERIAAVVNDEVISYTDVIARTNLAILSARLPNTEETRQKLIPQILRGLIDEKLQYQEARRNNITVSEQEITAALDRIAQQNNLTRETMIGGLTQRGIPISTMRSQITSAIAWSKLVQRRLRPSVQIGEDEIDSAVERLKANAGTPEYLVAEIFLGVDSPGQEDQVRRLADRLLEQLRGGANFVALARQFSQAAGAANGGDLGWVQPDQLARELATALKQMRPGQLSAPIRSSLGYHILLVRDQRVVSVNAAAATRVTLKQIVFPVRSADDRRPTAEKAAKLASGINSCADFDKAMGEQPPGLSGTVGPVKITDLPGELRQFALTLPVGKPSQPLIADRQVVLLIVCDRQAEEGANAARDAVATNIGQERLDMLQRRYLRDLRQAAFIEIRI